MPNDASTQVVSDDQIVLAHGGGGELTRQLVARHFLPKLANGLLDPLTDSAVLEVAAGRLALTTDSYVVQPIRFPGGDIGRLAVCGTVNDLAVSGARPIALTLAVVMEEGLTIGVLDEIVASIAAAAAEADVVVATGDTKVIEHRRGDGLMITTAGIGEVRPDARLDARRIATGDVLVISGRIAEHGLAVMSAREGLAFQTELVSDVAPLSSLVAAMFDSGADLKFLRDPTRGGLAGVSADLVEDTKLTLELEESAIPISRVARHTAELLGIDPLVVANEGKVLTVVPAGDADRLLAAMRSHPLGAHAAAIGRLVPSQPPLVELITRVGGRRIVQRPYGEELPRIC
ncbi:MAG: hydrogenase expression/formation protein HypE [Planctomycetes bacterium]|nr:hydrogenase expression/formation protein HypE [Planctomycetota bacterium]